MPTLIIASRNAHKAEEIGAILGDGFTVQTLAAFPDAPPVIEDGDSFAANATKKSREIAAWLENQAFGQALPDFVLADDSGLEVDALDGAPGIHSARYASGENEGNAADADNNAKLLRELAIVPASDRGAQFRCVLALTALGQADKTESGRSAKLNPAMEGSATIPYSSPTVSPKVSPNLVPPPKTPSATGPRPWPSWPRSFKPYPLCDPLRTLRHAHSQSYNLDSRHLRPSMTAYAHTDYKL